MLVEFRVKNFRSFRDEAVLNFVASVIGEMKKRASHLPGTNGSPGSCVRQALIGANAGGKSNLVRSIQLLRRIVNDSATLRADQPINVQPFRLDQKTAEQPIEYEITFLIGGARYQFGFVLTPRQILNEWLIVYKSTQPATWYERKYDSSSNKYVYKYSAQLLGAKSTWQEATRENALFLSTAVQLNSEQLRPVFHFLTRGLVILENGSVPISDYTIAYIDRNKSDGVREFLSAADIGIADIWLKKQQGMMRGLKLDLATGQMEPSQPEATQIVVPTFEHRTKSGSAVFDFADESKAREDCLTSRAPSSKFSSVVKSLS